ncbi:WhiB family transcriptional regulator [Gordonia sp. VNQ95]|uniref:WhiB family transcriptional regulator n=1 Tax=Gordonia sp. VNQ95 TaxID=3156619 RepID=UPI0032B314AB
MSQRARRDPGEVSLLAAILEGTTSLSGAACVGSEALFDPKGRDEESADADYRHQAAAELCRTCPVLDACRDWADQSDTNAVIAGRRPALPGNPGRPRKDSAA